MASVNFFLISRTQQQSEICKSCVARCTFWKYWKYITKVQLERRAQARRSLRRRRRNFWDSWASVALFVSSFFFLFLPLAPPNDHVFWNSHLECGNEGQIAVVMLTKGNSGAVNGLVTCICRSLAGNMEQNGAEVEILQKKLPQILWEFYVRYAGVSKFISGYVSLISWINARSMSPTWVKCARITPSGCWEPTEKAAWLSLYMATSDLAGVGTHGRTFVPEYYLGLILH